MSYVIFLKQKLSNLLMEKHEQELWRLKKGFLGVVFEFVDDWILRARFQVLRFIAKRVGNPNRKPRDGRLPPATPEEIQQTLEKFNGTSAWFCCSSF